MNDPFPDFDDCPSCLHQPYPNTYLSPTLKGMQNTVGDLAVLQSTLSSSLAIVSVSHGIAFYRLKFSGWMNEDS